MFPTYRTILPWMAQDTQYWSFKYIFGTAYSAKTEASEISPIHHIYQFPFFLQVAVANAVLREETTESQDCKTAAPRGSTAFINHPQLPSNGRYVRIAADSTMLRMVNLLIALSLGVHREQLLQRIGLTWPRPFLLRPLQNCQHFFQTNVIARFGILGCSLLNHVGRLCVLLSVSDRQNCETSTRFRSGRGASAWRTKTALVGGRFRLLLPLCLPWKHHRDHPFDFAVFGGRLLLELYKRAVTDTAEATCRLLVVLVARPRVDVASLLSSRAELCLASHVRSSNRPRVKPQRPSVQAELSSRSEMR